MIAIAAKGTGPGEGHVGESTKGSRVAHRRARVSPSLLAAGHRARRSALHVDAPLAVRLRHRTARTCQRLLQTLGVDSSSPRDRIRFPLALLCTAVAPLLTGYARLNSLPTQRPARATLDHISFLLISISAMTTMIPRFSAHQCRAFSASRATCRYSQRDRPQWRRARKSADCRRVCAPGRACACDVRVRSGRWGVRQ